MCVLLKLTWNENTILKRGLLRNFPISVNSNVQRVFFFLFLWAASVVTCFLSKEIYQAISPIRATHILSAEKRSNCMCVWLLISRSLLITNHYHSKPKVWTMKGICYWPAWTQRNRLKTECPTPNTPEVRQTMPPIPRDTHWARYSRESCGLMYSFSFFVFFSLGCRGRSSVRIKGWARLWPDRDDALPKKKERKHGGLCSEEGLWMDTEKWRTAVGKASRPWTSASRLEDDCRCPH